MTTTAILVIVLIYTLTGNIYLIWVYFRTMNKQNKGGYWLKLYKHDIPRLALEWLLWPIFMLIR